MEVIAESLASNSLFGLKTNTGRCYELQRQVSRTWLVDAYLEDYEFQLSDIVRMHPVLGRLTNEILLRPTSRGISLARVAPGSD